MGEIQDLIPFPLRCTVQAPHCATPHPNFVPMSPSSSLNTHKIGVEGSTSTLQALPFTFRFIITVVFFKCYLFCFPQRTLRFGERNVATLPRCVRCENFYTFFFKSSGRSGKLLTLFPVSVKSAFITAGAIGGTPGSPTPPIFSVLSSICTSTCGISFMRSIL